MFSFHLVIDLFGEWRLMVMAVCVGGEVEGGGAVAPCGLWGGRKGGGGVKKKKPSQLPREES